MYEKIFDKQLKLIEKLRELVEAPNIDWERYMKLKKKLDKVVKKIEGRLL